MGKIGLHEKINRLPIQFENEALLNCFLGIVKFFNHKKIDEPFVILKKQELWAMAGFKDNYREEEFRTLITQLTRSSTYKVKDGTTLSGSVFVTKRIDETGEIQIEIPQTFRPYIFTGKDITIMAKAKNKEKMEVQELDYWDRELKEKKKSLILLEEGERLGIRGKYALRLYMLLMQFKKTGFFVMNLDEFREVMEVPAAYTIGQMNAEVIKKSKKELEKKGIFTFDTDSKGRGRRKIEKIEIKFSIVKASSEKSPPAQYSEGSQKNIYEEIADREAAAPIPKAKIKVTQAEYEALYAQHLEKHNIKHTKIVEMVFKNQYEIIETEEKEEKITQAELKKLKAENPEEYSNLIRAEIEEIKAEVNTPSPLHGLSEQEEKETLEKILEQIQPQKAEKEAVIEIRIEDTIQNSEEILEQFQKLDRLAAKTFIKDLTKEFIKIEAAGMPMFLEATQENEEIAFKLFEMIIKQKLNAQMKEYFPKTKKVVHHTVKF